MPRASAALAWAWDSAEPPMMSFQRDRSMTLESGCTSSMCRMVGTQWEKVTPSSRTSLSRVSGT
jgi:hypothetical protein